MPPRPATSGYLAALLLLLAPVLQAEPIRVGTISTSINNWPLWVAEAKGFFDDQGLDVRVTVTGESEHQLDMVDAGELEIFHQAADHFVREIEHGKDYVVLHTITRAANDLLVRPEIETFADLRGKTIALDNLQTGYWLLFRRVLQKYGLQPGDYHLSPNSGGPTSRMQKVRDDVAQFTYMNAPASIRANLDGFPILTNLSEHYPEFPASSIGARRSWAESNRTGVIAYLRGYITATEWLLDPANRAEAIDIAIAIGHEAAAAPRSLDTLLHHGLVRYGTLSARGYRQVGELLREGGVIESFGDMTKYADPTYQQAARESLSAQRWQMPAESKRCPSRWGPDDERGAANLMTPDSVLAALQLVKTGKVFELGDVLSTDPSESYINRGRVFKLYTKATTPKPDARVSSEELVITELGQIGTQIDGFAHQMWGDSFYNCFRYDDIASRSGYSKLGIENVGTLIARGVLIDVAAAKKADILDPDYMITAEDLRQALARQHMKLQRGDAVIINTGWGRHRGKNNDLYGSGSPGIGTDAAAWLAEQQPLLVGADNCCIEFRSAENRRLDVHALLLIERGIYLLENMQLEALAAAQAHEFLFIVQPLKIKGATGSAVAPAAIQ
ncbi:MAG: cyclase family protein [Gammaproteobacteria bacterium]|nr:cyclase family protein [Gammaproteobacteria bacterium]